MEYLRDESSEADASGYQRVMRTRTLRIEQACTGKFRLALHGRNLAHGARSAKSQWVQVSSRRSLRCKYHRYQCRRDSISGVRCLRRYQSIPQPPFASAVETHHDAVILLLLLIRAVDTARAACPTAGLVRTMRAKAEWLWIDSKFSASTT